MTKREAKRWAYDIVAQLAITDLENSDEVVNASDPDAKKREEAIREVVRELKRRAGDVQGLYYAGTGTAHEATISDSTSGHGEAA